VLSKNYQGVSDNYKWDNHGAKGESNMKVSGRRFASWGFMGWKEGVSKGETQKKVKDCKKE